MKQTEIFLMEYWHAFLKKCQVAAVRRFAFLNDDDLFLS